MAVLKARWEPERLAAYAGLEAAWNLQAMASGTWNTRIWLAGLAFPLVFSIRITSQVSAHVKVERQRGETHRQE